MLCKRYVVPTVFLVILCVVAGCENSVDYGEEPAEKSPSENIHELYKLLLQRNAPLENAGFGGIPLEHLMIRKSQRSPSLRLRFGRSGPHGASGVLPRPVGAMVAGYEDNN